MKRRIILAISVMMVLGLAVAAIAYTRTGVTNKAAMSCCCSGDSCPMKGKDTSGAEKASCCDKDDCCCKGGSCPMKGKDSAEKHSASCCDKAESCPMKKKDGSASHVMVKHETSAEGEKTCCCSCCGAKKEV